MNRIKQCQITISFDVWEPKEKIFDMEYDKLITDFKTGKLLSSVGNVKTQMEIRKELTHDSDI